MAFYALSMGSIAAVLVATGARPAADLVVKFLEHFAMLSEAMNNQGLWDEEDGFYYDRLRLPDGSSVPLKVHSMVGIVPMLASVVLEEPMVSQSMRLRKRFSGILARQGLDVDTAAQTGLVRGEPGNRRML